MRLPATYSSVFQPQGILPTIVIGGSLLVRSEKDCPLRLFCIFFLEECISFQIKEESCSIYILFGIAHVSELHTLIYTQCSNYFLTYVTKKMNFISTFHII